VSDEVVKGGSRVKFMPYSDKTEKKRTDQGEEKNGGERVSLPNPLWVVM